MRFRCRTFSRELRQAAHLSRRASTANSQTSPNRAPISILWVQTSNQGDPVHLAQANALRALGDGAQATESFTYSISDGILSDDAVLRIKVTGVYRQFALTTSSDTFTGDAARPTLNNRKCDDIDERGFPRRAGA